MTATLGTKAIAAREAITELTHSGLGMQELLAEVSQRVRRVVPYTTTAYMVTDPATLLPTQTYLDSREHGLEPEIQIAYADNEYLVPDYVKMADLVRRERPVMTLREATGGNLSLSTRHREIHSLHNAQEELRVAFRAGESTWGVACMTRNEGEPEFSLAEQDFVASVSEHIATGLRLALQFDSREAPDPTQGDIPGILVLHSDDSVESITPEAEGWLAQLPGQHYRGLPVPIQHVARAARALATGRPGPVPRGRVRLDSGAWLLIRATELRGAAGAPDRTAIVLERARRSELAPLIVQLYELSQREREVTELLLRGLPIDSIAGSLSISKHTVRDHTKAIFGKLGVSSRPELTAKLFHEHVLPQSTLAAL